MLKIVFNFISHSFLQNIDSLKVKSFVAILLSFNHNLQSFKTLQKTGILKFSTLSNFQLVEYLMMHAMSVPNYTTAMSALNI